MVRFIFGLVFLFSTPVMAQAIRYAGHVASPGCGSVNVTFSPDGKTFSVLYDRLNLHLLPGQTEAVMECAVEIFVKKPTILGLKVNQADFRGFVGLSSGVRADQQVSVAAGLPGDLRHIFKDFESQTWVGPITENFNISVRHRNSGADILTCGFKSKTRISLKTKIRVRQTMGPSGEGLVAVDSTDGRFTQNFRIDWENCIGNIGGIIGGLIGR